MAQLLDQWLAVTTRTHDLDEILQSGSISYSCRDLGAVEIGSKTDAVLTYMFENVFEVPRSPGQRVYQHPDDRLGGDSW